MSITAYYTLHDDLPQIASQLTPSSTPIQLSYLSEGGANFVFRISSPDNTTTLPPPLQQKLLRLRKNASHVQSAIDQLKAFEVNFRRLFPAEHVVQHELVSLDQALAGNLNLFLAKLARPEHRLQDTLPLDEPHGLLVTDMTARDASDVVVQLKPKWLAQSPSAPPGAKRCRTCALRAQRGSVQMHTATDQQASCPLQLVSEAEAQRREVASAFTEDEKIVSFLAGDARALLGILREQQLLLDPRGVLGVQRSDEVAEVCRAMTLRDCTLFVRSSRGGVVEARLGDLDLKQPEKVARWREMEMGLQREGWYSNAEAEDVWTEETTCMLSRP